MTLTAKIITATVIALGIYDLWAVSTGGVESSISRFMQDVGFNAPFVILVFGYLAGHFWGYMPPVCPHCGKEYSLEEEKS